MIRHQALIITSPIVDSIPVIRRLPGTQIITILPEQICADARRVEGCLLPRALHAAVVRGDSVFLEETWLAGGFAGCAVGGDPAVAPVVGGTPLFSLVWILMARRVRGRGVRTAVRIQVECTKVNSIDTEVHRKVQALRELVRVAAVRVDVETEALYLSSAPTIRN